MKTYDETHENFKVGQCYDFVGGLHYEPLSPEEEQGREDMQEENGYLPTNEIPKMSRYPVLHLIGYQEWRYLPSTPLIPSIEANDMQAVKDTLLSHLTSVCLGDELTAKYLLQAMVSVVYNWEAGVPMLNLNVYAKEKEQVQ